MGHPKAIKELEGPPFPDELAYLWEWLQDLRLAVEVDSMTGNARLSWTTLQAWSTMRDVHPEPHEIEALILVHSATRSYAAILEQAEWT